MKYIVDFKNDALDSEISEYLDTNQCTVIKQWLNFEKVYLVESSSSLPTSSIIEFIEEDVPMKIKPLDMVPVNRYWGTHQDPNAEKIEVKVKDQKDWWKNYSYVNPEFERDTLQLTRLGKGINVYIMDSGIEKTHPEFSEATIVDLYTITPGDFSDKRGHGTAIASVVVGKTCGITNATIKNVKIFEPNHNTLQSEMLSALDAILSDHDDEVFGILNCSWIIDKNPWVEYKLRQLIDEGVWVICSAGNNGSSIEDVTPASMPEVVTVGAYNSDLVPCDFSAYTGSMLSTTSGITNHGELDGWAPGKDIWCASINGSYGYVMGTSIAAAITTAVIAANTSWYYYEDGSKFEYAKAWPNLLDPDALQSLGFSRFDLLDLSDEKYQNSANSIITLVDKSAFFLPMPPDELMTYHRVGTAKWGIRVFHPNSTSKIEIVDPLPPNFKLNPTGAIWADPTPDQGPVNGEPYKIYNSSFKRTNAETNEEEFVTLKIYVLPENFKPSDITPDDELNLLLQGFCSSAGAIKSCGPLTIQGTTCFSGCGNGSCCGLDPKNPRACICLN